MKTLFLFFVVAISFSTLTGYAQTGRQVKGTLQDSAGNSIIAASVKLVSAKDTLFTRSDADGTFTFNNVRSSQFLLTVSSLGYKSLNKKFYYKDDTSPISLDLIVLQTSSNLLNTVEVNGTPAVTIKEDTVSYRASDFPVRENSVVEDVLKKLPGVEVDKDGNVTAQGQSVTKVRVNGKDFFSGDVKTATQQLPADLIDKIEVIDDYGDQANLTGVKDGDPQKILNIQIRPDRNKGIFGKAVVGAGNEERYQATAVGNYFNNTRQVAFLANLNNTNANLFNFGSGGPGFSGRGSRRGSSSSFNNNSGPGITRLGSAGFNYRDEWGKKLSSYGSYSYFNRNNSVISSSVEENNYQTGSIINNESSDANTDGNNHRFNWSLEYKPDSVNYFKFSPSFSYSGNTGEEVSYSSSEYGNVSTGGRTIEQSTSNTPNLGADLLFNHRFKKPGRNISLSLQLSNSEDNSDRDVNDSTRYFTNNTYLDSLQHQQLKTDNQNFSAGSRLSYLEPVGLKSNIELYWSYNNRSYDNHRITHGIDPFGNVSEIDSLSNIFNYSFVTNRFGLSYRFNDKDYSYSLGVSAQPSVLTGNSASLNTSTRRTAFHIIPVARFQYKFSRTRAFNIYYSGRSTEPTFAEIQPVPDVSNPQYPVYGNPDLQAAFNHTLSIRYNNFDFASGNTLFANISANLTQDKIVRNVVVAAPDENNVAQGLRQETHYLNADGYYSINGFYSWSKPFAERKYTLSFRGNASYNNNVSFSNNEKNIGHNWILTQGLRFMANPGEWMELNPSVNYTYNVNNYSLEGSNNTHVNTVSLGIDGKVYFMKTFSLGFDASKNYNSGYSGSVDANPFILNTYIEKEFFKDKSGILRLQGYDLLNQGVNVSRSITDNTITDSQTNRLTRYFMLSFTMQLKRFNGKQMGPPEGGGMYRRRGPGGPGGPERHGGPGPDDF